MKLICIDDSNRPVEIPKSYWIEKDKEYELLIVTYHPLQKIQGCQFVSPDLEELDNCPYNSFALKRFAIRQEDVDKFIQLVKDCNDLNEIDFKKLLEETQLELV